MQLENDFDTTLIAGWYIGLSKEERQKFCKEMYEKIDKSINNYWHDLYMKSNQLIN